MSGTFNDIDVPPPLVSFAVDIASDKHIITPEFKKAGNKIVLMKLGRDEYDLPDYKEASDQYGKFFEDVKAGKIVSAYALDGNGIVPAVSKMAFGNKLGVKLEHNLDPRDAFAPGFGSIVAEVPAGKVGELSITYTVIGEVTEKDFSYGNVSISSDEALAAWKGTLEKVFPTVAVKDTTKVETPIYKADSIYVCRHKVARP